VDGDRSRRRTNIGIGGEKNRIFTAICDLQLTLSFRTKILAALPVALPREDPALARLTQPYRQHVDQESDSGSLLSTFCCLPVS